MLKIEKHECELITSEFRDLTLDDIAEALGVGLDECKKKWKEHKQPYKTRQALFEEHYKLGLRTKYEMYVYSRQARINELRDFIVKKTDAVNCRALEQPTPFIVRKYSKKELKGRLRV
ncbi:hypothetical protein [Piscirickettsia litoralis]|uniref:Phage protein n=1 Tax=Piscirickettsia litoralis TaxID=1891921 RepID=A0ABX2ZWM6_9GAMM|nr:hypothetical protein [Piscirickettsia litoralis]ODN41022.1 hypothetical protein BGC07_18495 [Piscirickettsia litoralis]